MDTLFPLLLPGYCRSNWAAMCFISAQGLFHGHTGLETANDRSATLCCSRIHDPKASVRGATGT